MYKVSDEYKVAVRGSSRRWKYRGIIKTADNKEYTFEEKDILKGSAYVSAECSGSSEIQIGTVYATEFGITLFSDVDRYSLRNGEIYFYASLETKPDKFEEIPIGIFNITEANRNKKTLELRAYDNMILLEKNFSNNITGGTIYEMLSLCSKKCKIELAQSEEYFNNCTNGTEIFGIFTENDIETWRDLVGYIAQSMGAFATINREGKLEFRKYEDEVNLVFSDNERFETSFSDFITKYTAVNSTNMRTKIAEYYALEEDDALTMNLGVNPLLQYGLRETRERIIKAILNDISKINYLPFDSNLPIDPSIDLGDVISFRKGSADETKISCVTGYSIKFGDKMTIRCVGKNPILSVSKSKNDKNIVGLLNKVETGKIATHTYINSPKIRLTDKNTLVSSIEFASKDDTDAHYMASILLEIICNKRNKKILFKPVLEKKSENTEDKKSEVEFPNYEYIFEEEENAVITVTYVFNDAEIKTYYPTETYMTGKHILNLYYPINSLKAGSYNTFKTFLNITGGTATIDRGQLIATVSGQGLSAKNKWDGQLKLSNEIPVLKPNIQINLLSISGNVVHEYIPNESMGLKDNIAKISNFGNNIPDYTAKILVNPIAIQQSVVYTSSWQMSKDVINLDKTLKLKTEYSFLGNSYDIDRGKVSKIIIDNSNFKRLDSLEVNID